jgi:hypothetical protein
VMAVQTSSGNTLPGILTITPSEQKWVFHAIYQLAFPELYSNEVCSHNRVVITDVDEAEYRSFKSVIETSKGFSRSKVLICTIQGIWMAFKKDLLALHDGCEHGKITISYIIYIQIHIYQFVPPFMYGLTCTNL